MQTKLKERKENRKGKKCKKKRKEREKKNIIKRKEIYNIQYPSQHKDKYL